MSEQIFQHPYATLTPDLVMDAIESTGLFCSAQVITLNSYENRVYQVGIEDQDPIIAKFYRPDRWTDEAILEEHSFTNELLDADVYLLSPNTYEDKSLHTYKGFRFALFKRQGGYAPELSCPDTLYRIGLNLGRIHQIGKIKQFQHRPSLSYKEWGFASRDFILNNNFIPGSLLAAYETISLDVLKKVEHTLEKFQYTSIRLHGDCHIGNILWRDDKPFFVDFDDCINGPAIQDIWLLLNGDRAQKTSQLVELLEGYEEFCDFDTKELQLIEPLRALRLIKYAAWLAQRWTDPAFPMHFPWFNTERYWSDHILELREQYANLDEAPLSTTLY